ncbi:recQ-mediated genome instability protein 1-like [Pectinophora gossypiella]|uniref:RecQ-mediated genome instability protein 1 n=1 Tax=Pectinophora gossypiella TaxID=13191 RepID=A0A1E1W8N1_PECGO|nr:recQ-mediated genome instability protein 1-like [Pectinophora gossypiella]
MSVNSLVNSVRSYLASQHMLVDDEWLSGCVEYLTEDSSNSYSETEIKSLAREQWLLNDLKDICPGSLPGNLKNMQKTRLDGRFTLQINAAIDIGTPAYQQYLKLQKVNTENIEVTTNYDDKIPSHRMIKLYLTDGVQEVTAIEYKPMRNLSCDITPGCKALIKGPLECRRGMLLLTEGNIELLGGEVQEIAVSNCLAGLLSTKLGLPMTQDPGDHNTTIIQRNTNLPTPHTQMPPRMENTPHFEDSSTTRPVARVTPSSTNIQTTSTNGFAEDDIDIDQIAAIEAQFDNSGKRPSSEKSSKPEKKIKMDTVNTTDDYPNDDDLFDEDEEYLREMEANFDAAEGAAKISSKSKVEPKFPINISAEPFVYIKQINELSNEDKTGRVFKVKGQIIKLLSKLSVGKDGWSLRCTLVDGTGTIDVEFTSNVLSKLVGYTPQEMNQLKKQMMTKPELKEKAVSALQKARDTLQVLYCIIELTILEVPKITCLIPFEGIHVNMLQKRIQGSGL